MMSKFIFIEAGGRVHMTYNFVLVMYNPGYTGLGLKALKKNSYKFMFLTTNLFIANLLKHLRSCQFMSLLLCSLLVPYD